MTSDVSDVAEASGVADAYDANAEAYAELFADELARDPQSLRALSVFVARASEIGRPVADLGCGPGTLVNHLHELGLDVVGFDISRGQLLQARTAFPDRRFEVADMTALDVADGSLGGIAARHSIIHLPPDELPKVFAGWRRKLTDGAPLFVSFFGSRRAAAHSTPFDHRVITAYELWPPTVGEQLAAAGFTDIDIVTNPIPPGGRPFDHTTILATH